MSAPVFDFDRSGVSRIYDQARALPPAATAVWRDALRNIVPTEARSISDVIDAGCGTGRFSALLAETFGADVLGVDPSPAMLAEARSGAVKSRCRFEAGALEALPAPDQSADLVFLSMVYHHVRDWEAAYRELRRVLRPGGVILIRTPVREAVSGYLWSRFFPQACAQDEARLPARADITARLTAAGFTFSAHRIVSHPFAEDAASYLAKIRLRGLSGLRLISDEAFATGVVALENHLQLRPGSASDFSESLDLFCFQLISEKQPQEAPPSDVA